MKFTEWINGTFDKKLSERLRHSSHITLSHKERDEMREYLTRYTQMKPIHEASRPRTERTRIVFHFSQALAALLIVVVTASTTVAAAAESSLPGETLYTIKVDVNESVRTAIALSPESKTAWAVERAERRIAELSALTERGDIDETLREEIDERIDEHVHDAEETTSLDDSTDDVEVRLLAVLRAHEALVAPISAGGLPESDATSAIVASIVHEEGSVSSSVAVAPAQESVAMTTTIDSADATFAARSAEAEPLSLSIEVEPTPETVEITTPIAETRAAKQTGNNPTISEKALKRQQKAAQQRIEALEKLLERLEKRNNAEHTAVIRDGLASARDAYTNAEELIADNNVTDASVLLNSALRIAIDAREQYGETIRNTTRNEREELPETRSDDDRETREERSSRNRDRGQHDD